MCSICGFHSCPSGCPSCEPEAVGYCKMCGEEIYAGEKIVEIDGENYHYECLTLDDVLELLDIKVTEAEDD